MSTKQDIKELSDDILDTATEVVTYGLIDEAPKPIKNIARGMIDVADGTLKVAGGVFDTITFGMFSTDGDDE